MVFQIPLPGVPVPLPGTDDLESFVSGAEDVVDEVGGFIDGLFGGDPNNQGPRTDCEADVMAGKDNPACAGVGGQVTGISNLSREIQRKARADRNVAEALADLVNGQGLEFEGAPPRNLEEAANYAAWAILNADAGGGGAVTQALRSSGLRNALQSASTDGGGSQTPDFPAGGGGTQEDQGLLERLFETIVLDPIEGALGQIEGRAQAAAGGATAGAEAERQRQEGALMQVVVVVVGVVAVLLVARFLNII